MKRFHYILREIFRFRGNALIRLISLVLGLGVAVLLFTYDTFQLSFDTFQPEGNRIYRIGMWFRIMESKESDQSPYTYQPVAASMKADMPEVEWATCILNQGEEGYKREENIFHFRTIYADTVLFRLFDYPVVSGKPEEQLGIKENIFISEKFAGRVFGEEDPVGKTLMSEGEEYTVAGVFADLPDNTHLHFDVVKSFEFLRDKMFMGWGGGDAFNTYIRLVKGALPEQVEARIPDMVQKYLEGPYEKIGFKMTLQPLSELYTKYSDKGIMAKVWLLSLLAFVILLVSALNYVLISLSSLVIKARLIGVHKVNGASRGDIFRMFIAETGVLLLVALLISGGMLLVFSQTIEAQLHVSLPVFFAWRNLWIVGMVSILLLLLAGVLPARIFSSVSVMQVFRQTSGGRKVWKRVLLGTQFVLAVFLITLLVIFNGQYDLLVNKDLGYNPKNLFFAQILNTTEGKEALRIKNELKHFPFIKGVTVVESLPLGGLSGNAITPLGESRSLFSTRWIPADEDFLEVLEVPILEGNRVKEEFQVARRAIVNQQFLKKLKLQPGEMFRSDYGETVLLSVCRDFNVSSLYQPQDPLMLEYLDLENPIVDYLSVYVLVRLQKVTSENLAIIRKTIGTMIPNQQPVLYSYEDQLMDNYADVYYMRNVVLVVGLLAFAITVLGLIGFVGDEVARRTKEIAIRKVNGATVTNVIGLLWKETGWLALFTLPVGLICAYVLSLRWLEQFAVKLSLSGWFFAGGLSITLSIILLTVTFRSYHAAMANPVKSLKSE